MHLDRHTHFGVDQVFSRHSIALRNKDVYTFDELKGQLMASYNMPGCSPLEVYDLKEAADVTSWLKDHLADNLVGVTEPHQFMFTKKVVDGVESVVVDTKLWSIVPEWTDGPVVLKARAVTGHEGSPAAMCGVCQVHMHGCSPADTTLLHYPPAVAPGRQSARCCASPAVPPPAQDLHRQGLPG